MAEGERKKTKTSMTDLSSCSSVSRATEEEEGRKEGGDKLWRRKRRRGGEGGQLISKEKEFLPTPSLEVGFSSSYKGGGSFGKGGKVFTVVGHC